MFLFSKKLSNCPGTSSKVSLASLIGLFLNSEKGTNYTISLSIYFLYFYEYRGSSSASKVSMLEKSSLPTPTIMIERGRPDPLTIWSIVAYKSLMIPSVISKRMKYFWFLYETFSFSAISTTSLITSLKCVGPYRLMFLSACL